MSVHGTYSTPGSAPSVSVAMATYNGMPYLEEQLQSIRSQSMAPTQIVVCDDGSTDGTWELVVALSAADPRIRAYRNGERLGSTKNFERAIGLCTAEVIFLSDQDDAWTPTKIEEMLAALQARNAMLVMSNGQLVREDGTPMGVSLWEANEIDSLRAQILQSPAAFELLARSCFFTGSAFCFRASLKDFVLPMPADIWHDQWIAMITALVEPGRLALLDRDLYRYRQHSRNQIGARVPAGFVTLQRSFWDRVWREITSHRDLVIDAKYCGLAVERIHWVAEHAPSVLHLAQVRSALDVLRRRREHSLARCAYIERRRPLWEPLARLRSYADLSHGLRTVVRDVLSRVLYRPNRELIS